MPVTSTFGENLKINSTNNETATDIFNDVKGVWLLSMIFTLVAMSFLFYVILAYSYHSFHHSLLLCSKGSGSHGAKQEASPKSQKKGFTFNVLIMLATFFSLMYVASTFPPLVELVKPFCAAYGRIKVTVFGIAIGLIYVTLWYRVYVAFYSNCWMKESITFTLRIINIFTVVFLFFSLVVNLALFYTSPPYVANDFGCVEVPRKNALVTKWIFEITCSSIFQCCLLYSFIFPLHMHRKHMLNRGFAAKSVIPVVKRAAVVAAVCVISDFINGCYMIFDKHSTMYTKNIVLCSNLLLNLVGVILSFKYWKEKLLPWACIKIAFTEVELQ